LCRRPQESQPAGTSDLAQLGRKVSGNAQQRKRHHLLQHGTLLYQFDRFLTERYLYMPRRQPDYRQQRSHAEFLDNLPVSAEELKARLRQCWQAEEKLSSWPRDLVHRLLQEKYSQAEWVRRR
jgi:lipoate-protein ligase A